MPDAAFHVPAWRKLGLKLKYAKDTSDASSSPNKTHRSTGAVATQTVNEAKRRKLSSPDSRYRELYKKRGSEAESDGQGYSNEQSASGTAAITSALKVVKERRKSVTFVPDTKADDGTSNRELFNEWRQEEYVDDSIASQPALRVIEQSHNSGDAKSKKPKKSKRSKSTLLEGAHEAETVVHEPGKTANWNEAASSTSPALQYLDAFHRLRETWKFNKARQNQLFKQIFDVNKIPSSYDDALLVYLEGLQSPAARKQLQERALEIRQKDGEDGLDSDPSRDSTMSEGDVERQKDAYRRARRQAKASAKLDKIYEEEAYQQLSQEWKYRFKRRLRSEKMLEKLGEPMPESIQTPERGKTGIDFKIERVVVKDDGGGEKRKRKRKRRTNMPIDDSSSSESDSSDDENSEAEAMAKLKAFVESKDEGVSKDESGSESESEDESESGDEGESDDEEEGKSEDGGTINNDVPNGEEGTSEGSSGSGSGTSDSNDKADE